MGAFEDYINSLDGQENLDVTEVVSNMHRLYNEETETMTSKIASQESAITAANEAIAARDSDIQKWKAKNWDLVNSVPVSGGGNAPEPQKNEATGLPDSASITLDDMFKE